MALAAPALCVCVPLTHLWQVLPCVPLWYVDQVMSHVTKAGRLGVLKDAADMQCNDVLTGSTANVQA
jgi:hypothetical protein